MTPHAPLIIDIAGPVLAAADMARLRHPLVGGLILFARNWQSREQLTGLCQSIKRVRTDLLIMVDHEGGRVQRFKTGGFTHLPAMRSLGEWWKHGVPGDPQASALGATRAATACSRCQSCACWALSFVRSNGRGVGTVSNGGGKISCPLSST